MSGDSTDEDSKENAEMRKDGSGNAAAEHALPVDTIDARKLLGNRGMVRIELDGEMYTLRVTRNNRLILTK